jgi:hypothetical protein
VFVPAGAPRQHLHPYCIRRCDLCHCRRTVEGPKQEDAVYGLECWQHDQRGRLLVLSHLDTAASNVDLYGSPKKLAGEQFWRVEVKTEVCWCMQTLGHNIEFVWWYVTELNVYNFLSFWPYVKTVHISVAHPCMIPVDWVCFSNRMLIVLQGAWLREVVHQNAHYVLFFFFVRCLSNP